MPSTLPDDLSTDKKYLHDMCNAISVGVCPVDLSLRNPGLMNHSRWLTTGNRILRLYVSTANPSDQLKELVLFIVRVYAPMWFAIKMKPSCKDGGRHVFETINKSRYKKKDLHRVVDPVIQRNGYFGHPENLLLSMITDARPHIRELGVRRIMKARKEAKLVTVRVFKVPTLNFEAEDYTSMIDWRKEPITEPPVTMKIDDETLLRFIHEDVTPIVSFSRYPCHTQAVERHIKLVTEASAAVCGKESRDGFIRVWLESQAKMPKFETKIQHKI
ncbi:hypothetical protein GWK47_020547 [Chionoecetes opilio]|uniref:Uncharacterized protein n=1 Tax=Chionoecetes opilio TaxID=41210 RepID=A0A8J4XY73_CHIOP|nr:hypothetical protein GWK47_020547 [Chionoecetes opilio]